MPGVYAAAAPNHVTSVRRMVGHRSHGQHASVACGKPPPARYVASGGTAARAPTGLPFARSARAGDGPVSKRLRVAPVRGRSEPQESEQSSARTAGAGTARPGATRPGATRPGTAGPAPAAARSAAPTRSVTRAAEKSSDHVADAIERVIHQVERAVHHVPRDVDHGRRRRSRRRQRHRHGQRRRDDRRDRRCGRVRGGGGQGVRRGQLSWGRTGCHRCGRGGGSRRDGRRWRGGRWSRQRRGTRRGRDRGDLASGGLCVWRRRTDDAASVGAVGALASSDEAAGHFAWEQAAHAYGGLVADWVSGGYGRVSDS